MKNYHYYQNLILLCPSDEAEPGSGGDQPARNSLTGWNGKQGAKYPPTNPFFLFQPLCLKKRIASREAKKRTEYDTKKRTKETVTNPKKGQRISGQDTVCPEV